MTKVGFELIASRLIIEAAEKVMSFLLSDFFVLPTPMILIIGGCLLKGHIFITNIHKKADLNDGPLTVCCGSFDPLPSYGPILSNCNKIITLSTLRSKEKCPADAF